MPGLVQNVVILATADGLVLQPRLHPQHRFDPPTLQVNYSTGSIARTDRLVSTQVGADAPSLDVHGVIGLLNITTHTYLIAINRRKQVATIWGKSIYQITDIVIIPLSSHAEAVRAITTAAQNSAHDEPSGPGLNTLSDLLDDADNDPIIKSENTWLDERQKSASHSRGPSRTSDAPSEYHSAGGVAQDVIGRKGAYGRFAERWFSRRGWTSEQQKNLGMSSHDDLPALKSPTQSRRSSGSQSHQLRSTETSSTKLTSSSPLASDMREATSDSSQVADTTRIIETVLPKLLQTLKLVLISNTFYFSYDLDVTRRCVNQPSRASDTPLYKQCDPQYVWNAHILEPFVGGGFVEYVLPIMQGFVGQRSFEVDRQPSHLVSQTPANIIQDASSREPNSLADVASQAEPRHISSFILTLVSRKSVRRAGFRYMRRGVDDKGNVANCVETEQILSSPVRNAQPVRSFVQTRGSIPLYYSQSPYNFKPSPALHGTLEANQLAFRRHFTSLSTEYGEVQAVSLIDRHGGEVTIGDAYESHVRLLNKQGGLNDKQLKFDWFDFHDVCRGMKFENVSILIDSLTPFLKSIKWSTVDTESGRPRDLQKGIIRTNCMDCLDRTNVVQSAIAQHVLTQQLSTCLPTYADSPSSTPDPTAAAFNALWADNGDALSLTYAGTAALKGDYVRTRRRNFVGILTDLSLTLSRYYRNIFDDFFAQAALDFVLGNVNESVFLEFKERMTTADPSVNLARAREMAIASAGKVVVSETEDLLGGWTLSAPAPLIDQAIVIANTSAEAGKVNVSSLRAQPFREMLLLLSNAALYSVSYDWDAEKVRGFERVALAQVRRLQVGTYITQTLTTSQQDPERNFGLLVEFEVGLDEPVVCRVNTRTMDAVETLTHSTEGQPLQRENSNRVLVYKAVPQPPNPLSHASEHGPATFHQKEIIRDICKAIEEAGLRQTDTLLASKTSTGPGNDNRAKALKSTVEQTDEKRQISSSAKTLLSDLIKIEEKEILSLEEAQKATSIVEQVGYGLKKILWG